MTLLTVNIMLYSVDGRCIKENNVILVMIDRGKPKRS